MVQIILRWPDQLLGWLNHPIDQPISTMSPATFLLLLFFFSVLCSQSKLFIQNEQPDKIKNE
jgi:hypothetical protein